VVIGCCESGRTGEKQSQKEWKTPYNQTGNGSSSGDSLKTEIGSKPKGCDDKRSTIPGPRVRKARPENQDKKEKSGKARNRVTPQRK
jgi:hypothetical protein